MRKSVGTSHSMMMLGVLLVAALCGEGRALAANAADGLPRKPMLGAVLGPVSPELRRKNKLQNDQGVAVLKVLPGTSAEAGGLQTGDVVKSINGKAIPNVKEFLSAIAASKTGNRLEFELSREGENLNKLIELREKPVKKGEGFDYLYDFVVSGGNRLRTIVTRPKEAGRHPALLLIQGLGNFSLDTPAGSPMGYERIVEALSRAGYVIMMVDKPGCGDSEGGPWPEIDFMTELDGYRQGLKALKAYPFVDAKRVFLFGHSMGGVMAPLVASENQVAGVAVYGTVFRTWFEYQVENIRRQSRLAGEDFVSVEQAARDETALLAELYLRKKSPAEIASEHPELRKHMSEMIPDGKHVFGGSIKFFQQLSDLNMPKAWAGTDAQVLAIWGKGDFVAPEVDHAMIAEAVNAAHPGKGQNIVLDCDHGFARAASFQESFGKSGEGEFNPVIISTLKDWMDRVSRGKSGSSTVTGS